MCASAEEGARLAFGGAGRTDTAASMSPALFIDSQTRMRIAQEEI